MSWCKCRRFWNDDLREHDDVEVLFQKCLALLNGEPFSFAEEQAHDAVLREVCRHEPLLVLLEAERWHVMQGLNDAMGLDHNVGLRWDRPREGTDVRFELGVGEMVGHGSLRISSIHFMGNGGFTQPHESSEFMIFLSVIDEFLKGEVSECFRTPT